jgi:hypothetical protein
MLLAALLAFSGLATIAMAFPPAPFFTIHGTVRDEYGQTIRLVGAQVIFLRSGQEVARYPIGQISGLNDNFQIRLRMDMRRFGTQTYSEIAQGTGDQFALVVLINNVRYFPIEMKFDRSLGAPGDRVRIDLTLGEDSDGDGLPDAWEISQLYAGGILPDDAGWPLHLIGRDGDFDGDGISNYAEYIAGTFATDPTDYLALKLVEKQANSVRLRFFSILGKAYSLEYSTDLRTWRPLPFYTANPEINAGAQTQPSLVAPGTQAVEIYAPSGDSATFYRLVVR